MPKIIDYGRAQFPSSSKGKGIPQKNAVDFVMNNETQLIDCGYDHVKRSQKYANGNKEYSLDIWLAFIMFDKYGFDKFSMEVTSYFKSVQTLKKKYLAKHIYKHDYNLFSETPKVLTIKQLFNSIKEILVNEQKDAHEKDTEFDVHIYDNGKDMKIVQTVPPEMKSPIPRR